MPPESSSLSSSDQNGKDVTPPSSEINVTPKIASTKPINPSEELPTPFYLQEVKSSNPWLLLVAISVMLLGLGINLPWVGLTSVLTGHCSCDSGMVSNLFDPPRANHLNWVYGVCSIVGRHCLLFQCLPKYWELAQSVQI